MSPKEYENGIQFLSAATPLDDMIYLMKRDGSIIVKNLVPIEDIDQANKDVRPRLDEDLEWEGDFFPST
jgi:hypothetical protein